MIMACGLSLKAKKKKNLECQICESDHVSIYENLQKKFADSQSAFKV